MTSQALFHQDVQSHTRGSLGSLGRLGRWSATHRRTVFISWVLIVVGLGTVAPRAETALSGAGWQDSGSQSVQARDLIQTNFHGLSSNGLLVVLHSSTQTVGAPAFTAAIARSTTILRTSPDVSSVVPPTRGISISNDRHTAIIRAGAAADPTAMVQAADSLERELSHAGRGDVTVSLTGASAMWSDFNNANRNAMMRSEIYSWPVTLAILALAFGALVAAGLPLMLTIVGLIAAAGSLYISSRIGEVSIWAMNFALMFALALGIDYALFIVNRFRGALFGSKLDPVDAVAETMDTAGKAVLFSGATVLVSISAVMLVPSPAFRSTALGIMLAVTFILAASLTLLPATLAKLGPRIDKGALRWVHSREHRSPAFRRWAERLWRHPGIFGTLALAILIALALPILGLRTAMPSIKVVPNGDPSRQGYDLIQQAFGTGAPGALQIVGPSASAAATATVLHRDTGIARVLPTQIAGSRRLALIEAVPKQDPSSKNVGTTIDRLRTTLPTGMLVGGGAAENHDLETVLDARTPLVIGVVLGLGFLLLLIALQAPVIAAVGVLTNLLAVGAAFGVARLIFQDGHGSGLLGFQSQGFVDAWGPVFFFAMIFAISMDYTVFLLSSAKEHWERSGNAREAMIGGVTDSGRVIFAAAAVMIAVFFTFALSGPLPPKEMGVILGVAVLLDAILIRLVLLPVALRLLGPTAWTLPSWLRRLLPDVRFAHSSTVPTRRSQTATSSQHDLRPGHPRTGNGAGNRQARDTRRSHQMPTPGGQMTKRATTTVRYETHTTIDRPISDVFARLADLHGYRTWMPHTGLFRRSGQTSDGPLGPGTAYFDATRMGTFHGEVTNYEAPTRIGFRETLRWYGFDLMEARPSYVLEADRDHTIVHHVAEGELFGIMRFMKPIANLMARSERTRTVKSLRRSLESD